MKYKESKADRRQNVYNSTARLRASPLVRRFATRIGAAAGSAPILDVACGSGRNTIVFAELGCCIICLDRDQELLCRLPNNPRILPLQMDVEVDRWPFDRGQLGGIVNVHFLLSAMLRHFKSSLSPGGYLLIETVPAHGQNYLELPKEGELRTALEKAFDLEFYKEKKTGPPEYKKVTVRLLARRRDRVHARSPSAPIFNPSNHIG